MQTQKNANKRIEKSACLIVVYPTELSVKIALILFYHKA